MILNDVVEFHAIGRPCQILRFRVRRLRRLVERPAEHPAHVVSVIVLATLLGLVAKNPLIDADVAVIAKMRFNDVVEIDASRRPLRQRRRAIPKAATAATTIEQRYGRSASSHDFPRTTRSNGNWREV